LPLSLLMLLVDVISTRVIYRGTNQPGGRTVVITGCDTGFGRMAAVQLDALGYRVIAACLKEESVKELTEKCSQRFNAFVCDVTKDKDVAAFAAQVEKVTSNGSIYALINNAGVLDYGPIEWVPMAHYYRDMEVNYFGLVRMTRAMLPFLRKKGGRVVNVASIAGTISVGFTSPYSATKYAVQAFSDALRREMSKFNLDVVIIEPSIMKTPMVDDFNAFEKLHESLPSSIQEDYGKDYLPKAVETVKKWKKSENDPQLVVNGMKAALSATYPATRYRCGWDAQSQFPILAHLPGFLQDCLLELSVPSIGPCKPSLV